MQQKASVLIIDDDLMHQQIYGWIVEAAGFRALLAVVRFDRVELPDEAAGLVLLDYHLGGPTTSLTTAQELRRRHPATPVLVLSDALTLPEEMTPYVQGFVRKGNPATLVETLRQFLQPAAEARRESQAATAQTLPG